MAQSKNSRAVADPVFKGYVVIIAVLLTILLGVLIYGFISNLLLSRELQVVLQQISAYEEPGTNPPSGERMRFLESGITQMKVYLEELRAWPFMKDTLAGKRSGDALALKEALYGIERKLRERGGAEQAAVEWPKSFGFEQLQSAIPSEEELPNLFYQVEIFERLGSAIIDTGVVSVNVFSFRPAKSDDRAGRKEVQKTTQAFSEYLLDVEVTGPYDRIVRLIDQVRRLEHLVSFAKATIGPSEKNPEHLEGKFEIRVVYV